MKPIRLIPVIVLAFVACGEEDVTPERYTPAVEKKALAADDITPELSEIATAGLRPPRRHAPATSLGGSFTGYSGALLSGSAVLAAAGAQTRIDVRLTGGARNGHYEGAVRRGGCERIGPRLAALNPVSVDSVGAGRAVTLVPVPIDSLGASPHVLVFGRGGRPEACAPVAVADGG